MNPFRTMIERGIEVGAGSDAPVAPFDPVLSIAACESHHAPSQRLSRVEAVRLHTVGSARVGHQEEKKGALGPGMHADLVAYDDDPMTAASIEGLRPILTVSLGREVFAR
jgi:predicted amidohydrolase YtcJ